MPRYRSSRSGAIYAHSGPLRPEDEEVQDDVSPGPMRRAHDERLESLTMQVSLFAEQFQLHLRDEAEQHKTSEEWRREASATLAEIRSVLDALSASRRVGLWLLATAAAVGAFVTWTLDVWEHLRK